MRAVTTPHVPEQAVLAALRDAFADLSRGTSSAPGQFAVGLPGGGDVIHYPAVRPGAGIYAVKVSPYPPRPSGGALVTAWTMLVSLSTGQPLALLDASGLTAERTAATTVLAADLLLPSDDARTAAIVGYGRPGRAHARYLRLVRPGMAGRAFSRSRPQSVDDGVQAVAGVREAVAGADLVMLCTSVAGDVPDPLIWPRARSSPRSRPTPPTTAAELVQAAASGWDAAAVRGDLAGLVAGHAPRPGGQRQVYFRSVGPGTEDAAVARAAYEYDTDTTDTTEEQP
ncbi:ornithine cyclodeaminase family protein [Streptomyces roseochromogenus]|uniref:ornithine cyclodeaminase family protein n=1 Tax=Streptomyces roseochromogenus TaxID=285450 RepID=UPI00131A09C9|nr:ornithine cyclodeaminase family protein [Streptomyces roseochromogenus]